MAQGLQKLAACVIGICHNDKPLQFAACDKLVCLTQGGIETARRQGWYEDDLHLIPHFHEAEKTDAPAKPTAPLTIGAAGRMVAKKNLSLFIDIAAIVKQTHPEIRFQLAGTGTLESTLRAYNKKQGSPVRFAGWVDMPAFLSELDMMIIPSLDEPFGFVFPEAMAQGIALLATPTKGAYHCLAQGTIAPIISADRPQDFAAEICQLADDLACLHKRQIACHNHARHSLFAKQTAAKAWQKLIKQSAR